MAIASNINAATNASSVVKGEGREAVIDELQGSVADLLDLTDDVDIPEVSLPQEGGVQGSLELILLICKTVMSLIFGVVVRVLKR